jgi:hypothetical protein
MKRFLPILFLVLSFHTQAQVKWLPNFVNRMFFDQDSTRKSSFVVVPVLTSAPETGVEFGGSALYSYYSDTVKGSLTRVSSIYGYATVTTKGQSRFSISSHYWSPENIWHFYATIGYINYPFNFYGIGNNTRVADKELVDEKRFKFSFNGESLVAKNLYAGFVSGALDFKYSGIDLSNDHFTGESPITNINGGALVFVGPSLTYDTRDNNTYSTRGLVVNSYYNMMHGLLGNNNYLGGFFNIEYSQFFLLQKKLVLGLDVQEQSLTGGLSPFYLLPSLGSDEMMRGYYNGRYRDRNFIAGQAELRYRINDRLGIVGFLGTGEVTHNMFSISTLKPNYGGGVRYFFDTEKGLSIRADYGIGQKPAGEARESGFYIALGQSF